MRHIINRVAVYSAAIIGGVLVGLAIGFIIKAQY